MASTSHNTDFDFSAFGSVFDVLTKLHESSVRRLHRRHHLAFEQRQNVGVVAHLLLNDRIVVVVTAGFEEEPAKEEDSLMICGSLLGMADSPVVSLLGQIILELLECGRVPARNLNSIWHILVAERVHDGGRRLVRGGRRRR